MYIETPKTSHNMFDDFCQCFKWPCFFIFFFRRVTQKACVGVNRHLLSSLPWTHFCFLLDPWLSTCPLEVHSAWQCLQTWKLAYLSQQIPALPHQQPFQPQPLLPQHQQPHPRPRSGKRKRKVRAKGPVYAITSLTTGTITVFISYREDRWVPTGQVSRGWCEVQGQANWYRWCPRGQRRQDVSGLNDETEGTQTIQTLLWAIIINQHIHWTLKMTGFITFFICLFRA